MSEKVGFNESLQLKGASLYFMCKNCGGEGVSDCNLENVVTTIELHFTPRLSSPGLGSAGGGIDSSLSLLSLFNNYQNIGPGLGGLGGQPQQQQGGIVLYPGSSSGINTGYNSAGYYAPGSSGQLAQYGIQQPAIVPSSQFGKRSVDAVKKKINIQSRKTKTKKKKQAASETRKVTNKSKNHKQKQSWRKRITTKRPQLRKQIVKTTTRGPVWRKTASPQYRKSKIVTTQSSKKLKSKAKRKFERKQKRKRKRKQKRIKMKRIEKSVLGKVPKERIADFKKKFGQGKWKTKNVKKFKFLNNLQFPYTDSGSLKPDFRKIAEEKVINILPDYCEEIALEKLNKESKEKECKNRAKRIRARVEQRLKDLYS